MISKCTVCIDAQPNGNPRLLKQEFRGHQRMNVAQYRQIIEQCKGRVSAVSLYYFGDPITHPDLNEMCRIACEARMAVHVNTNFSMRLTDDRIRQMVTSGLTHLTICVDGLSQDQYQKTRVGGRIDLVLENLRRLCLYRRQLGLTYPKVEVQFIKFTHNIHELKDAIRLCQQMGVDQFSDFWGSLANYTDRDPDTFNVLAPRKNTWRPQCIYPYVYMLIKYNGDVIPCCEYRSGTQYTSVDNPRVLGNVFETSVHAVWNAPAYRQARRMVANPESICSEPFQREHFCYGCPKIFYTDLSNKDIRTQRMEQFYTFDEEGPTRSPSRDDTNNKIKTLPSEVSTRGAA